MTDFDEERGRADRMSIGARSTAARGSARAHCSVRLVAARRGLE